MRLLEDHELGSVSGGLSILPGGHGSDWSFTLGLQPGDIVVYGRNPFNSDEHVLSYDQVWNYSERQFDGAGAGGEGSAQSDEIVVTAPLDRHQRDAFRSIAKWGTVLLSTGVAIGGGEFAVAGKALYEGYLISVLGNRAAGQLAGAVASQMVNDQLEEIIFDGLVKNYIRDLRDDGVVNGSPRGVDY
jgi:hypothetical protein